MCLLFLLSLIITLNKTVYRHKLGHQIIVSLSLTMTVLQSERIRGSLCVFAFFFLLLFQKVKWTPSTSQWNEQMTGWSFSTHFCGTCFHSAHFKPSRIPLVRTQGWWDKEKAITNTEEEVDSITNINQCLQHPFFFPIYISLNQDGSVNHLALKEKKVLTFNEESLHVHSVPVIMKHHIYFWKHFK